MRTSKADLVWDFMTRVVVGALIGIATHSAAFRVATYFTLTMFRDWLA